VGAVPAAYFGGGALLDTRKLELSIAQLRWICDPASLNLECTSDVTPLREFIGQDRAIKSLTFGLELKRSGYNIYVAGLSGTGKSSAVKDHLQKIIKDQQKKEGTYKADDWCYVYEFSDPDRPRIVRMPKGIGKGFAGQMTTLTQRLRDELGKVFSSEEYRNERKRIVEEGQTFQGKVFGQVESEARSRGFVLQMSPIGPVLIPVVDGSPMSQADYLSLDEKKRKRLDEERASLMRLLEQSFDKAREKEKQTVIAVRGFDRKVAQLSVHNLFSELLSDYRKYPQVDRYLKDLETYALDNADIFKQGEQPAAQLPMMYGGMPGERDPFLPFKVNVFVDNSETEGPPVIAETNPTWGNLFGKVERRFLFGGYLTDHTMLKAGSLGRANGGYLLLDVKDVLTKPGVWESLKRAIRTRELRIEDPFEQFGLIAPVGMRPEAMPMDVKVVLIGDGYVYQLLAAYDEEFWELFRVKADFDYQMDRTQVNSEAFACFISSCCADEKLQHFDATGVAKVLEFAARSVADQEKLSARFGQLKDVVIEADYWARKDCSKLIKAEHVKQAVDERIYRHNMVDERINEMIAKGAIMIDVQGAVAGQVNGLSVYGLGDIVFGKPSRITARTYLGRSGLVNIERESQMSGPIHNKGVLILGGYLGWKYAQDKPLTLSATLCFEQSYEGVEGDSASSTELYALLSSLSGVPVKQCIAVTGSVNQLGEIQPIGGVNHKIEGFYRVCKAQGLTGEQGVMIPAKNIKNLMLHEEVLDAVKEGRFHVWAVNTVDEGIELLTGDVSGQRSVDGKFPDGSINFLVDKRLSEMATALKGYQSEPFKS